MNKELDKKIEKAMMQITNFCEECGSHECCPEEECVLWRIEQLLLEGENENENYNFNNTRDHRSTSNMESNIKY